MYRASYRVFSNWFIWNLFMCFRLYGKVYSRLYKYRYFHVYFQVVNHKDGKGVPPLVMAVKYGYLEICRLLLENDADINAVENKTKRTPVYYAIRNKHLDILDLLLK